MVERGGLEYPIRVRDEFSAVTAKFRDELALSKKALIDFKKVAAGNKSAASDIQAQAKATTALATAQEKLAKATDKSSKSKKKQRPLSREERIAAGQKAKADKKAAKAAEKRRKAALETHKANIRATKVSRSQAKALDEKAKVQRRLERTSIALRKAMEADARAEQRVIDAKKRATIAAQKAADALNPEIRARKANERAALAEATSIKRVALLKDEARGQFARGDFRAGAKTLANAKKIEKSLKGQLGTAQKLLFTFRRLVGALAIFTLARRALQGFKNLVSEGVKFNDVVANAQLGIAGLVITLGDVRDAQGLSVDATEQLGIALGIAREQTQKLRQDSLKTVATFEQLLDTFQVSVGPGLAAGLDLDEVRQLTVDISQAAAALGVPQNQLAEEVRSLLSGTIQARTTRIATALGISNEDIRRLKEAGILFDFLEEKFAGFAEAAEKQARTTFSGISTLIKGLVQEILGESARPLFEELIELGNDLFDNFLSIKDAAGNIRPSPEVVGAFQQVFDAIKRSVVAFRELGEGSAINTLDAVLAGIAISIDFITGVATQLVSIFASAAGTVKELAEFLGIATDDMGALAQFAGKWLVNVILIKKAIGLINVGMLKIAIRAAPILAVFFGIAKALEFMVESIFGVDVGIKDTIQLVALGLFGAWVSVSEVVQTVAIKIVSSLIVALEKTIAAAKRFARKGKGFIDAIFGDSDEEQIAEGVKRNARELADQLRIVNIAKAGVAAVAKVRAKAAADQLAIEEKIAKIIGDRSGDNAKGAGFREGFDPTQAAADAAKAANSFVSTVQRPIADLGESLAKVNEELTKSEQLFAQAQASKGVGGLAGQVESTFNKEEIASAERLRKIKGDLSKVEADINRLREASGTSAEREAQILTALLTKVEDRERAVAELNILEGEGGLVSALRDQLLLEDAINSAEGDSLRLAGLRAAILAAEALPALREENALLAAQVAQERSLTTSLTTRKGTREAALAAARTELAVAQETARVARNRNEAEITALIKKAVLIDNDAERKALIKTIDALKIRKGFEEEILELRLMQLEAAEKEADLIANGSLSDGLERGFTDLAESFGNKFQAGIDIATTAINGFVSFASQAIVDAFDPTKESGTIKENFARLLQEISRVILQKLIELAIAKLLIEAGFGGGGEEGNKGVENAAKIGVTQISTATAVAAIRLTNAIAIAALRSAGGGFSSGGEVTDPGDVVVGLAKGGQVISDHFSKRAQGLARGGRPAHIPRSDTVPAWLTPGEFVIRKAAAKAIGLPNLEAMNGGNMSVVGDASAAGATGTGGMAHGGLVSERLAANNALDSDEAGPGLVVVPAIVANDREMDALTAGGRNAMLAFMRDEAGNINSLLDRSNRQG